jgi:hypothetical protein
MVDSENVGNYWLHLGPKEHYSVLSAAFSGVAP